MGLDRFPKAEVDGAVAVLTALSRVPTESQLPALALACAAAIKAMPLGADTGEAAP